MKTQINFDEHLAEHFTLREMIQSGTACRLGIENIPDEKQVAHLRALCQEVLEPLRRRFGVIRISSGFRCEVLNKAVGGVPNSQHLRGQAADIHCSTMEEAQVKFNYIRRYLSFDQLLLEQRLSNGCCWLHVSYVSRERNRHDSRFLKEK